MVVGDKLLTYRPNRGWGVLQAAVDVTRRPIDHGERKADETRHDVDTGCPIAPHCLECPLDMCVEDTNSPKTAYLRQRIWESGLRGVDELEEWGYEREAALRYAKLMRKGYQDFILSR